MLICGKRFISRGSSLTEFRHNKGEDIPCVEKKTEGMKVKKVNFSCFLGFFISLQNQIKRDEFTSKYYGCDEKRHEIKR